MNPAVLFVWEMAHYSLLALGLAVGSASVWLPVTGITQDKPGRVPGIFLIIAAVVVIAIWQDVRLGHTCAIHGTCRR